jgi:GPR1/FUN34/yaaH family
MIVSMAIFLGGFAQVFAGLMAWKKGSVFGGTAFCAFGLFWFSLAGLLLLPGTGLIGAPHPISVASYFFLWGIHLCHADSHPEAGQQSDNDHIRDSLPAVHTSGYRKCHREQRSAPYSRLRRAHHGSSSYIHSPCYSA